MQSALGNHFEQQRKAKAVSLGQLPSVLHYRNGNKARRLWDQFIHSGSCSTAFLRTAAVAFDVPAATITRLIEEDIQRWERWADEPVTPYINIRFMAAVYSRVAIPEGLTLEQAEAFSASKATEIGFRVCLVWSRRLLVFFDHKGEVVCRFNSTPWCDARPYMSIKGRSFLLRFDSK
jgi:hypothetical protein